MFCPQGKSVLFSTDIFVNGLYYGSTVYLLDIETKHVEKLYTVSRKFIDVTGVCPGPEVLGTAPEGQTDD